MLDHDTIVRHAYQLQPLPQSCTRLAALVAQEFPDVKEITEVIACDPVLTAKLLRVTNSAYYSPERRYIGTVKEAVLRLGATSVFSLAVAGCAEAVLEQAVPGYGLSSGELWRHSVATALVAELARDYCQAPWPPMAYTAALLHDLGKLILGRFFTPELAALCRRAVEEGHLVPHQAEAEVLSLHHGEVSGLIAQHWKLPSEIVSGVTYHHTPAEGGDTVCYVTHLANTVAREIAGNPPVREAERRAVAATQDRLGLTQEGYEKLTEAAARKFDEVSRRFD